MTLVNPISHTVLFLAEKNASTSLREALDGKNGWYRMQVSAWENPPGPWDSWSDVRFVGVSRNPYERILSYWAYWTKVGGQAVDHLPFEEWVKQTEQPDHTCQVEWYRHFNLSTCLRVENLLYDFKFLPHVEFLELPWKNRSSNNWYEEYYTDKKVVDIVNEWIGDDCEFGRGYKKIVL